MKLEDITVPFQQHVADELFRIAEAQGVTAAQIIRDAVSHHLATCVEKAAPHVLTVGAPGFAEEAPKFAQMFVVDELNFLDSGSTRKAS